MSSSDCNIWSAFRMLALLLIIACAAVLSIAPVSAETGVTVIAQGDQSYYRGERVVFHGVNPNSDTTYLFITGPGISENGGKLTAPEEDVVSGDPGTFTLAATKPDQSWEFVLYTDNLNFTPGSYTVIAVTQPLAKDTIGAGISDNAKVIFKMPFISAAISPKPVLAGQPFTVSGYAEGDPPAVQLWILGDTFFSIITVPVDNEANYTFTADAQYSEKLAAGEYYLIAEHAMADNQFDITFDGESVIAMQDGESTRLFKVSGEGSLQGYNAAEAIVSALVEREKGEKIYERDTHAIARFTVNET